MQTNDFIMQAMNAHPGSCSHRDITGVDGQQEHLHGAYIYIKTNLIDTISQVVVTCPSHGDFEVLPLLHLNGGRWGGCPTCFANWEDKVL